MEMVTLVEGSKVFQGSLFLLFMGLVGIPLLWYVLFGRWKLHEKPVIKHVVTKYPAVFLVVGILTCLGYAGKSWYEFYAIGFDANEIRVRYLPPRGEHRFAADTVRSLRVISCKGLWTLKFISNDTHESVEINGDGELFAVVDRFRELIGKEIKWIRRESRWDAGHEVDESEIRNNR